MKLFKRKRSSNRQPIPICKSYSNGHCAVCPSVRHIASIEEEYINRIQCQLDSLLTICPIGQHFGNGDAYIDVFEDRIQYTNTRTKTVYISNIHTNMSGIHWYTHTTDLSYTKNRGLEEIIRDQEDLTQLVALRIGIEYVKTF